MGLIKAKGTHFGHKAKESLEDEKFLIYLTGSIKIDVDIIVALCGDLIINIDWGSIGWYVKRKKLYAPGNFKGLAFMLYYFYS